jgi:Phosphate starvation-inducible protein PhoH, predicted ATPase
VDQQEIFEPTSNSPNLSKSQKRAARREKKKLSEGSTGAAPLTAKTQNQREYIALLKAGESVFGVGPAGTGKTYIPARIAARQMLDKKISKIIIARITAAPNQRHAMGFLPGKLEDKLAPWMVPVLDGLKAEVSGVTLDKWKQEKRLEYASFEQLRGRTFSDCMVILDEAQNATFADLKLFLTRIGEDCQVVVTGDIEQIDIRDSGLERVMDMAEDYGVPMEIVEFGAEDVVRSAFTKAWVAAFAAESGQSVANLDDLPRFLHTAPKSTSPAT